MCGRYAFYISPERLRKIFVLENTVDFAPRYNCAPMQKLPLIVKNRIGLARWGFRPPWQAQDNPGFAAQMINARSETVFEKPAFRESWAKRRRCLVPASGFYEWKEIKGAKEKQPFYVRPAKKEEVIAYAGLWSKAGDIVTFTILTRPASTPLRTVHPRMPVIITSRHARAWFECDEQAAREMISQPPAAALTFYPVSRDVGNVKNDHPALIEKAQ